MKNNRMFVAALGALAISGVAMADTSTGTLTVEATVDNACTVSTAPVSFANVGTAVVDATGSVTVQCTNTGPFTVALDGGENGDVNARTLSHDTLSTSFTYQLFTDTSRATVWGDGTVGNGIVLPGTGPLQTLNVYGRTTSAPTAAGDYDDTVNVTVTF